MEKELLEHCSPSKRASIQFKDEEMGHKYGFLAKFHTGSEAIEKQFDTIKDAIAWINKMEAGHQGGRLAKGMRVINSGKASEVPCWHG